MHDRRLNSEGFRETLAVEAERLHSFIVNRISGTLNWFTRILCLEWLNDSMVELGSDFVHENLVSDQVESHVAMSHSDGL